MDQSALVALYAFHSIFVFLMRTRIGAQFGAHAPKGGERKTRLGARFAPLSAPPCACAPARRRPDTLILGALRLQNVLPPSPNRLEVGSENEGAA